MNRTVRVHTPHKASYAEFIAVKKGTQVALGRRDSEWPGWIWCTNDSGKSSWVPETYLDIHEKTGIFRQDYDARELTVEIGDLLAVETEAAGWLFCRSKSGEFGWVPKKCTE